LWESETFAQSDNKIRVLPFMTRAGLIRAI